MYGSPAIQVFELMSAGNFYLSKFILKIQINVSHQIKSLKPKGTLLDIPNMPCQ